MLMNKEFIVLHGKEKSISWKVNMNVQLREREGEARIRWRWKNCCIGFISDSIEFCVRKKKEKLKLSQVEIQDWKGFIIIAEIFTSIMIFNWFIHFVYPSWTIPCQNILIPVMFSCDDIYHQITGRGKIKLPWWWSWCLRFIIIQNYWKLSR